MQNHDVSWFPVETPLQVVRRMTRQFDAEVLAKLEYMNPAWSHHYRAAEAVVRDTEERKEINPGMTLVDWTSGSSGIALAMVGIRRGYKVLLAVADSMSAEKQAMLRALGADLVLTPSDAVPGAGRGCRVVAENLVKSLPNSFYSNLYDNPVSKQVHAGQTGPELFRQTGGRVTHVFVPLGSGALASGLAEYLKGQNPSIRIIGVEPAGSVYRSLLYRDMEWEAEATVQEEIGAMQPSSFEVTALLDDVVQVRDFDAFNCGREMLRSESIFGGSASGAVMSAFLEHGGALGNDACVVLLMSDFGGYSLGRMYSDEWMRERNLYRKTHSAAELLTAEDILHMKVRRDLIAASPEHTLAEVFEMMKQNDVSQVPIVSYNIPIGSISENRILSILIENDTAMTAKVVGFMEQPFPLCPLYAPLPEVSEKLQQNASGVLVPLSDGRFQLITKSDLIYALTHK